MRTKAQQAAIVAARVEARRQFTMAHEGRPRWKAKSKQTDRAIAIIARRCTYNDYKYE